MEVVNNILVDENLSGVGVVVANNVLGLWPAAPPVGWTGKITGITNPAKINGIAVANIGKVMGAS